jgi:hypothetical protein
MKNGINMFCMASTFCFAVKTMEIRVLICFVCFVMACTILCLVQDTASIDMSMIITSRLLTPERGIIAPKTGIHDNPFLVVGILSQLAQDDAVIFNSTWHSKAILEGSLIISFVRCMGIDQNATTVHTKAWTVFVNCSSCRQEFENCDKALAWLKFAVKTYPGAMFIGKSDSDSCINGDKLVAFMQNLSLTLPSKPLYVGRGMQVFINLHNSICFGPVPFIGGMMEIFSHTLISKLQCSYSVLGSMGEDVIFGHSLMHGKVQYTMISCDECFHDKELPLSANSIVVHGFKAGSKLKMVQVANELTVGENSGLDYNVVAYASHGKTEAPFHKWAGTCSNRCISVVGLVPEKLGKFHTVLQTAKEPIVAYDLGLSREDFEKFSFQWREKVDVQQFPMKDPSQEVIMSWVSRLYNSTCVTWMDVV